MMDDDTKAPVPTGGSEEGPLDGIDPELLARVRALRLMDDDFMTAVFAGDNRLTGLLLGILLSRGDLRVTRSMTQRELHNLFGRSVRLDILAEDAEGRLYNVEVQRADGFADPRRARYNLSQIDSHTVPRGADVRRLPETYVIFITEDDYFGRGLPVYRVRKSIDGADLPFDDGSHILYVNGAYRGQDAIGHLMHDFCEADADRMYYGEIAERVRYHKNETKEVRRMSRIIEEYVEKRAEELAEELAEARAEELAEARAEKRAAEARAEMASKLLRDGTLTAEKISEISDVPLERVEELARQMG